MRSDLRSRPRPTPRCPTSASAVPHHHHPSPLASPPCRHQPAGSVSARHQPRACGPEPRVRDPTRRVPPEAHRVRSLSLCFRPLQTSCRSTPFACSQPMSCRSPTPATRVSARTQTPADAELRSGHDGSLIASCFGIRSCRNANGSDDDQRHASASTVVPLRSHFSMSTLR
jgi:hypothetical protein